MCGGTLEISNNESVATCEYCGTQQTLPKTADDVVANLFNRANNLRLKCEFDKAAQIYEKIVEQDDSEAEAHWGLVLCKYGIEYVEDPKTLQRIPTCHRTLFDAVTTDTDYQAAIDYSDAAQQEIYEREARAIDRIQKDILAIVKNEKPFDVFICYKESDNDGKRTVDSVIANDIYHQLTQEGFKVFYAAITLEDKLGQEYEPYIFAALNSAKVMLVLGTRPEYFSAVWVKNEWSRFLQLMKSDRSKLLIPCYRDMDAYDLPEEFSHLQAQDMGKIGFINDVVRGIKKVATTDAPQETVVKETVVSAANTNTAPLLKRAFMFLEDGDWNSANEYCEKVLDIDPECAQAYLGKLMADLRVKTQEALKDQVEPFHNNSNYQKVIRFADEKLKNDLIGYVEYINTRNKNARLERIYSNAKKSMAEANSEMAFKAAAQMFESIAEYQDSSALAKACDEKAEGARKDAILAKGKRFMTGTAVQPYESAISLFKSISGWKDADEQSIACQKKIEELQAKAEADRLERERQREIRRIAKEKRAKRNKKNALITTPIVCAIIAFIFLLNTVIIPNIQYNNAISLMEEGKYAEAIAVFEALGDYKDSKEKAEDAALEQKKYNFIKTFGQEVYDSLGVVEVGSCITFGLYEQDNNISNGSEEIEWLVLDMSDEKILLISKYALECKAFNTVKTDVTWETCSIRNWLNNEFINSAFSTEDQARISTMTVSADKNPHYSTYPGKDTQDKVFLLSVNEAKNYFNSDSARQCAPTSYASAKGAIVNNNTGTCQWWLRTPGFMKNTAAYVGAYGSIDSSYYRDVSNVCGAIRPAMWIDLTVE